MHVGLLILFIHLCWHRAMPRAGASARSQEKVALQFPPQAREQRSRADGAGSDDVLEPLSQHSRAGGAGSDDVLEPLSL
jgi:hypothetical protein